jgi:hypothetical protein
MIGPNLRKALRWAAVILMLFGPAMAVIRIYELLQTDFMLTDSRLDFWLGSLVGIASTVVQGGVLLVLLSIDERMQGEKV